MSKKIQNTILKLNLVKDRDSVSLPFAKTYPTCGGDLWWIAEWRDRYHWWELLAQVFGAIFVNT